MPPRTHCPPGWYQSATDQLYLLLPVSLHETWLSGRVSKPCGMKEVERKSFGSSPFVWGKSAFFVPRSAGEKSKQSTDKGVYPGSVLVFHFRLRWLNSFSTFIMRPLLKSVADRLNAGPHGGKTSRLVGSEMFPETVHQPIICISSGGRLPALIPEFQSLC